ncbi:hypothetical protein HDV00_008260 [Rhizophlyctis rosea]|nr:hypothetical protein HDV00_008260 [Rhizophlyctis rosea]
MTLQERYGFDNETLTKSQRKRLQQTLGTKLHPGTNQPLWARMVNKHIFPKKKVSEADRLYAEAAARVYIHGTWGGDKVFPNETPIEEEELVEAGEVGSRKRKGKEKEKEEKGKKEKADKTRKRRQVGDE